MLLTGLERLEAEPSLLAELLSRRRPRAAHPRAAYPRAALLANPGSATRELRRGVEIAQAALAAAGGELALLLGPEHGFYGEAQAYEIVPDGRDRRSGLPVLSLYDEGRGPPRAGLLEGLDLLLVDLQDVGLRCYTYLSTLDLLIGAIAELEAAGSPAPLLLVLDRPNPLGGLAVEGMGVEEPCLSFVGCRDLPLRHGLSLGEFALLSASGRAESVAVLPMEGWRRGALWPETGLPWIPPSPNLPCFDSLLAYGATVLLEGTNLSEGRGTAKPFEVIGAPWIEPEGLAEAIAGLGLPGLVPRPHRFVPSLSKHAGIACGGVQLHLKDPARHEPARAGYLILCLLRDLYPEFEFLPGAGARPFIDLITGNGLARAGAPAAELLLRAERESAAFRELRRPFLLYPGEEA